MKANIINLKKRIDRWDYITTAWKNAPFELKQIEAKPNPNIFHGVFLEHRELLDIAHKNKEEFLLIMEDDAEPQADWETRWKHILKYLHENDDWDLFNGGIHDVQDKFNKVVKLKDEGITTYLLDVQRGAASHFVYMRVETCLEKLKCWEEEGKPDFDGWYCSKLRTKACVPFIATQKDDYSDNAKDTRIWSDIFRHSQDLLMLRAFRMFQSNV